MNFELQQEDWDALYQAHKEIRARVDLYEYVPDTNEIFTFRKYDEISGVVIEGDIDVDANSDVRRTANLTLHVLDSSFVITTEQRIWVNKYVNLWIGYQSDRTGNILWYTQGFFQIQSVDYRYSSTEQTLKLDLADMMVSLDGTSNGAIWGAPVLIEADSQSIQRAMRDILHQRGNWWKDWIEPIGPYGKEEVVTENRIPYRIEMSEDATVNDIIVKLRDLYPGYETFFDLDGTFRCRRLPTCMDDPVVMTHDQLYPLVIEESSNSLDLAAIRNVTEVWGHEYEGDEAVSSSSGTDGTYATTYFCDECTGSNGEYVCTAESFKLPDFNDNMVFTFVPNHDNPTSCSLKINDIGPYPIIMYLPGSGQDKEIPENFIQRNQVVRVQFERSPDNKRRFVYIGRTKIHAIHKLVSREQTWVDKAFDLQEYNCQNITYSVNPDSPLTVDRIGERHQVLTGGDYDNILNEQDAADTAMYETWKATNLAYTLTLQTMLVPWLDVNEKISYYSPLFQMIDREHGIEPNWGSAPQYIIKRINKSLSKGTMSIEMIRFYPLYPFIITDTQVHTSRK